MSKKYFLLGVIFLSFFAITKDAYALTPVARFDVVPYQRIKHDNSFKVGVVAFSKPGIQKVEFSATGQGYSGGTKTSTTMSLNDRTGVWEYWVSFPASDFTGNGPVTINAKVTDKSGNYRNLTLDMIVEGASAFTPVTAWVSPTGNNSTCTVNNQSSPCQTVAGAISKVQTANGGSSNGAIIYLQEGTYSVANTSANTSNEWLTITKAPSANRDRVVIDTGRLGTGYLKYDSVTLQSRGSGLYVATNASTRLWTNNCRRIGSGYDLVNSNPVHHSSEDHYSTNDYTYDADYGYRRAALVRGAEIIKIGNDVFENTSFVINSTFTDQENSHGWHADAYQVFSNNASSPPANNRIIYNYKATNLHYQGVFARSDYGQATDNAFVNVFMEMREPPMPNESGLYSFTPVSFYQNWDHLILWNCTFIGHSGGMYGTYTNSSFVGNVFDAYVSVETPVGTQTLPSAEPGNASNNEYLYNHFNQIYQETLSCYKNPVYIEKGWPCPLWGAKKPDSGSPSTYTKNYGALDEDYRSATFGYPVQGSLMINRFTSRVPVDANDRVRGAMSDVGALETGSDPTPPPATCSDGIQNQGETGVDCGGPCSACAVVTYQCNDGTDNDSDGLVDYPNDPGCASATDNNEYNSSVSSGGGGGSGGGGSTKSSSVTVASTTTTKTTTSTSSTTNWVHTVTPGETPAFTNISKTVSNQYGEPYFTYRGVSAMLLKAHKKDSLIILVAGSGSTFQKIGQKGVLYRDGKSYDFSWNSVWPVGADGYILGKAYYMLKPGDPLYDLSQAFGANMQMTLPGCDNPTCAVNGWLLQEYGVE